MDYAGKTSDFCPIMIDGFELAKLISSQIVDKKPHQYETHNFLKKFLLSSNMRLVLSLFLLFFG